MAARGYDVKAAPDADAAMEWLRSHRIDVLVSDLEMRGGGLPLLAFARSTLPATRSIAIAAASTVQERETALRLGAVRVLAKPLSLLELADAVGLARDCGEGFHGWLHRVSLVDVLQMYHHAAQSLVLRVHGDVDGEIAIRHGELVHAECGAKTGVEALVALLAARRGELETAALVHAERTLEGSFEHVLLDGLRAIDEVRRGPGDAPAVLDAWFDEPVDHEPVDRDALVQWLALHAPGAAMWRLDPVAATLDRVDAPGLHPEHEIAGAMGSIGWAYELAEATDPGWTRVELTCGSTAIALVRAGAVTLAFARLVTGDEVQRLFHIESARLASWLVRQLEGGR